MKYEHYVKLYLLELATNRSLKKVQHSAGEHEDTTCECVSVKVPAQTIYLSAALSTVNMNKVALLNRVFLS